MRSKISWLQYPKKNAIIIKMEIIIILSYPPFRKRKYVKIRGSFNILVKRGINDRILHFCFMKMHFAKSVLSSFRFYCTKIDVTRFLLCKKPISKRNHISNLYTWWLLFRRLTLKFNMDTSWMEKHRVQ